MLIYVLHERMLCIENQRLLSLKGILIYVAVRHAVHLHHIHVAAHFLGDGNHGRNIFVFQVFNLYIKLIPAEHFPEQLLHLLALGLQIAAAALHVVRDIGVDSLELHLVVHLLHMADKRRINRVDQLVRLLLLSAEHVDIL